MKIQEIVSCDPDVLGGTAVFSGTRVPVSNLIDHLKAGEDIDDFLDGYPTVNRLQIEAILDVALNAVVSDCRDASAS